MLATAGAASAWSSYPGLDASMTNQLVSGLEVEEILRVGEAWAAFGGGHQRVRVLTGDWPVVQFQADGDPADHYVDA